MKFTVAANHEFKETEIITSVKSSLNSYSLWVTLYLFFYVRINNLQIYVAEIQNEIAEIKNKIDEFYLSSK